MGYRFHPPLRDHLPDHRLGDSDRRGDASSSRTQLLDGAASTVNAIDPAHQGRISICTEVASL